MSQSSMNCRMTRRQLFARGGMAALGAGLLPRAGARGASARRSSGPGPLLLLRRRPAAGARRPCSTRSAGWGGSSRGRRSRSKSTSPATPMTGWAISPSASPRGPTPTSSPPPSTCWDARARGASACWKAPGDRPNRCRSIFPRRAGIRQCSRAPPPTWNLKTPTFWATARSTCRFPVPHGGHLFPAFDLNHSYEDCDVFVSIAKLKEHMTAGITLSMKNCFGITPCTIYGDGAPEDEAGRVPLGGRFPIHSGLRQPAKCSPAENDPKSPREGGYRVPRCVADLVAARPIHLAIIDGIESQTGGGDRRPPGPAMLRRTCWWPAPTPFAWMRWAPP